MAKTFLKLLLSVVVYSVVFMLANALLPFSQGFRELGANGDPTALIFMLISTSWICFTIYFIIKNTNFRGKILFFNLLFIMFFIGFFMTQIETLFFVKAFPSLTKMDTVLIMIAGLFPLLAMIPLLIKFFQNKNNVNEAVKLNIKTIVPKLGIIGLIYLCVYMIFGYFVAWQFEELRVFYTGSSEKLDFFGQLINNFRTNPIIYPFQIIRGILFGIFIIPLLSMVNKNQKTFILSLCLVYLCTSIVLIIPNVLFPNIVRLAHFAEMMASMLIFGIIVGKIMWVNTEAKNST
jgi:hypothetical protein